MATLAQIRAGLASQLAALDGVQVSEYMLANPTPPCLEIGLEEKTYDLAGSRGLDDWQFVVRAYVGLASDLGAQRKLDELMNPTGASSVKTALEATAAGGPVTLGGVVASVHVKSLRGPRIYSRAGGPEFLGCEWVVQVLT